MRVTFCCTGTKAEPWLDGLRAALPGADISVWAPGAPQADYAVVWAPPQQFTGRAARAEGAVQHRCRGGRPAQAEAAPQAQVVRLDDAGMSVQMAEYVTQAVIRHFRDLDAYEADMRQGQWAIPQAQLRADFPVGVMGLGVLGERVAKALGVFEFPCAAGAAAPAQIDGVQTFDGEAGFHDFLRGTRVLVNLLPLTPETREHPVTATRCSNCCPAPTLINVARGAHLVEEDLVALIAQGHVAGAMLDVFRQEPLPAGHPFWSIRRSP